MEKWRWAFDQELEAIRAAVLEMAASLVEAIPRTTRVLLDADLEGAGYIIQSDANFHAAAQAIEHRCIDVLRLQAPVAADLRQVVSAMQIVAEIERSADLLANICKATRRIYGHSFDHQLGGLITMLGSQATRVHVAAIDAFIDNDAAKASALDDMDLYLNDLHGQFLNAIFESQAAGRIDLQVAMQLALVARFYERIGDHAVNVGNRVHYFVTARLQQRQHVER
jgi:phosphate transport system protein